MGLRPIRKSSITTLAVSSTLLLVEPNLTTLSLLLDGELMRPLVTTTSSETPGPPAGESKDTSESLPSRTPLVSVESNKNLLSPPPTEPNLSCNQIFIELSTQ